MYWNKNKTKSENKNTIIECRYFLESNFVGLNRLLPLVNSNAGDNAKKYKAWRYYLPKVNIENYNIIINWQKFYNQPIDSDIERFKEMSKSTRGQRENSTIGSLLDYD